MVRTGYTADIFLIRYLRRYYPDVHSRLCRKVKVAFAREGDKHESDAFIRALEEATRNTVLTEADYEAIAAEVRANREHREQAEG